MRCGTRCASPMRRELAARPPRAAASTCSSRASASCASGSMDAGDTAPRLRPLLGARARAPGAALRALRPSRWRATRAAGASCCRPTCAPRARCAGSPAAPAARSCTRSSTPGGSALARGDGRARWRGSTGRPTSSPSGRRSCPCRSRATRERERGYNQSAELARALARRVGDPGVGRGAGTLTRDRDANRLTPEERRSNVSGAFRVRAGARSALRGAHLVLVDDVVTTGATLNACAPRSSPAARASSAS